MHTDHISKSSETRTACAEALAVIGRRFPAITEMIGRELVEAATEPEYDRCDNSGLSGHDYAFDTLWMLVVDGK